MIGHSQMESRLSVLEKPPSLNPENSVLKALERSGFVKRGFIKWAGAMAAFLTLPASFTPMVAKATELADRLPVIWFHIVECAGCGESLLRGDAPTIDSLIFNRTSLEYHETVMAAAGQQAEESLESAIEKYKSKYILVAEGGIPMEDIENFLTIGPHGESGHEPPEIASENALAISAIGTCSSFGGTRAVRPNLGNAQSLSEVTSKIVINMPSCPPGEENIVGNVLHYSLFGELSALDAYNRPEQAYGLEIHDSCERRGHFDVSESVQNFGDEGAENGYCLYKVGCRDPHTFSSRSRGRFNQHTSWPIQARHSCMGCSKPSFWDAMGPSEEPMASHKFDTVFGLGADNILDKIGTGVLTLVGIAIAAHAVIASVKKNEE